ncbi:hypothetical protein A4A49_09311 [Nicotiana attenuata]|uniref:Uncharacterized protein n=1 Tax=Nicotiana attenuata TaxID=49451 RepID=A0A1J6I792_NICAT|nr:hypothetical protein A4A49_09311 [Nicotiana attenuata]
MRWICDSATVFEHVVVSYQIFFSCFSKTEIQLRFDLSFYSSSLILEKLDYLNWILYCLHVYIGTFYRSDLNCDEIM